MKIRIDLDGREATTTPDVATARDFASLLPLTLTLEDYNGREDHVGCFSASRRCRMRLRVYAMLLLPVIASVSAETIPLTRSKERSRNATMSQEITITRSGTQPPSSGSSQYFTGSVRIEPLFDAKEPARANGASVTFEPGARTAWHTHPLGQTLIVTAGEGRVQRWGDRVEAIRAGDVVWIPPAVKHWHGAGATTRMAHTAIQEHVGGKNVEWLEHVTDEQYRQSPAASSEAHMVTFEDVRRVSPAFEVYTKDTLLGGLWKRPGLLPRDRSVVTVAALIARNHTIEMPYHFNLALDNGVKPGELSEIITHLAFYSGWANATAAVAIAKDIFDTRKIRPDQLPPVAGPRLPLDEGAEAQRAARVAEDVGPVAPGLEQYTTDVLFRDLWLRSGLAPRDRSLVTVSALIALGQVTQIPYHLNRTMDNGLTKAEASEVLTHLAFYAGWPNAFSAVPRGEGRVRQEAALKLCEQELR